MVPTLLLMILTRRALNRAVLARQLLLDRVALPVTDAVERLLGLNAQSPNPPYVALWSRLSPFTIDDLTTAIDDRSLVRSTLIRATQHIVSARDFHLVRPAVAALLRRVQRTTFGTHGRRRPRRTGHRELFNLPDAPLPEEDTPAPVRLIPEFDAPLLAYADRRRVMTDEVRRAVCVGAGVDRTVLVDGTVAATWQTTENGTLTVHPFRTLTAQEKTDITQEALALLDFTHPGYDHDVRHLSATPL